MQTLTAILVPILAGKSLLLLAKTRRKLAGTTLTTPWAWVVLSLLAAASLAIAPIFFSPWDPFRQSYGRYLVGVLSFMPVMAVLGASRPRDRGWPVVMVGLLVILLLPAGESWLWRPGTPLLIEGARSWFLAILIALGIATFGLTRFWPSTLALALAQAILLWDSLPWSLPGQLIPVLSLWGPAAAGLLGCFAVEFAGWTSRQERRPATAPSSTTGMSAAEIELLDRVWRDFRDAFGMLWGLRVVERMNASARMYHWPVTLAWSGFVPAEGQAAGAPLDASTAAQINAVFENLLLRFVSPEWIAERKRAS